MSWRALLCATGTTAGGPAMLLRCQCPQSQAQPVRPCQAAAHLQVPQGPGCRQPHQQHQRWSAVLRTACQASTSGSSPSEQPRQDFSRHQPTLSGPSSPEGGDGRNPVLRWLRIVAKALRIAMLRAQAWAADLGATGVKRCRSWLGRTRYVHARGLHGSCDAPVHDAEPRRCRPRVTMFTLLLLVLSMACGVFEPLRKPPQEVRCLSIVQCWPATVHSH